MKDFKRDQSSANVIMEPYEFWFQNKPILLNLVQQTVDQITYKTVQLAKSYNWGKNHSNHSRTVRDKKYTPRKNSQYQVKCNILAATYAQEFFGSRKKPCISVTKHQHRLTKSSQTFWS